MTLWQRAFLLAMVLLAIIAVGIAGALWPATAQDVTCFAYVPRADMVENLATKHNEHQVGVGVLAETHTMQLFLSDDGSWTVLMVDITGMACLMLAGEDWQFTPEKQPSH